MSVSLAVALLALLVASFTVVALVAVLARVRGLEVGAAAGLSGYPALVGRPAPAAVRPGPGERGALVAVVDGDCALCRTLLDALAAAPVLRGVRVVVLGDRAPVDHVSPVDVRVDAAARAELFEGYAPTLIAVDAGGTVVARRFVYSDTDVPAVLRELTGRATTGPAPTEPAPTEPAPTEPAPTEPVRPGAGRPGPTEVSRA
jgi:hypothetical protein